MKKAIYAAVGVMLILPLSCASLGGGHAGHGGKKSGVPVYAEKVNWHTLAEGKVIALEEKRPMVVDFATPEGCDRCEFLEDNVYNRDEIVEKINRDFIPVWINLDMARHTLTEEEKAFGRKFEYNNDCLLLFTDYRGEVITDPEGKKFCFAEEVEPEEFMMYLDYVRMEYLPESAE